MTVMSGGTASDVTFVSNFGSLNVAAGATLQGLIGLDADLVTININGSVMPTAVISGFNASDDISLVNIPDVAGATATYNAGAVTVTEGSQSYALNFAPSPAYSAGTFFMSSGFGGTDIGFLGSGSFIVSGGQTSQGLAIAGNEFLGVNSGGTVSASTLSGTQPFLTYQPSILNGGTLHFVTGSGAVALERNSGTDIGNQVQFGGNLLNVGQVQNATVTSGGFLFTLEGTVNNAVVSANGIELVAFFGAATGTVLDGGLEGLAAYGTASGTVVNSGGEQVVGGQVDLGGGDILPLPYGTADFTVVNSGGLQFVNALSDAESTRINAGGEMIVNSAGTAGNPVIGGGGTLVLNSFAVVSGGIVLWGVGAVLDIGGTSMPTATISGFTDGNFIDLMNVAAAGASATIDTSSDVLTISAGGSTYPLALAGRYAGAIFNVTSSGPGASIVTVSGAGIPCFAAGTRIATESGEVAVEALREGDRVVLRDGRIAPIVWVGHRRVDCAHHPRADQVWPVRVAAGAFGSGLPHSDLRLSPDHAVYVGGVLIPVKHLVNGTSIAVEPVDVVVYYHIELAAHEIMLAQALPVESYLDTGDRRAFDNGGTTVMLHPDFSTRMWEAMGCAPLVVTGPKLAAARRRVNALANDLPRQTARRVRR